MGTVSGPREPWPPPYHGPQPPHPGAERKPAPQRPHEVRVAVWLWVATLVVGLVGLIVSFGSIDTVARAQVAANPEVADVIDPDTFVRILSYAVVVVSLLGVALRVFLIVKLAAGRRWARTVLTVLGGLSILGAVLNVRAVGGFEAGLSVLDALVVAAAIVYMFSEGTRGFFSPPPRR